MWVLRLSLKLGIPVWELEALVSARELAEYQALTEVDGPWWGEREAAYLRTLASVTAATAGADIAPDRFALEWTVGASDQAAANLLPADDGIALFAARYGLDVEEVPS